MKFRIKKYLFLAIEVMYLCIPGWFFFQWVDVLKLALNSEDYATQYYVLSLVPLAAMFLFTRLHLKFSQNKLDITYHRGVYDGLDKAQSFIKKYKEEHIKNKPQLSVVKNKDNP